MALSFFYFSKSFGFYFNHILISITIYVFLKNNIKGGHEDKESLVTFICVPFFCYGSSMHKLCTSAGEIFFLPGLGKQFYYIISGMRIRIFFPRIRIRLSWKKKLRIRIRHEIEMKKKIYLYFR